MSKTIEKSEIIVEDTGDSENNKGAFRATNQFINLIFGTIIFLLLIRFIFKLTGANPNAGIVAFTYSLTNFFMAPFEFIFPSQVVSGAIMEWSVLVAMIFYALLAWIIMKLIAIFFTTK
jgi:hypothetical protein